MLLSVIKTFKQFGTTENLPRRGRKLKTSARTARKLFPQIDINSCVAWKNIVKSLDAMDIQHWLNRNGLYGNRLRRTFLHTQCHIVARFNFAKMPKWTKKIAFENKYYGMVKIKLCFWGIMMYRFLTRKVRLSS